MGAGGPMRKVGNSGLEMIMILNTKDVCVISDPTHINFCICYRDKTQWVRSNET